MSKMSQIPQIERVQPPYFAENHKLLDQDEEEEEALSLCDLPDTSTQTQDAEKGKDPNLDYGYESDFDFDFGSLTGSVTGLEPEMCAADEVFSGGLLLPFRHSVSSETGLSGFRVPTRSISRSESMGRVGLVSGSSRSSSTSSSSSTSMAIIPKARRNHFHSCPSPRPQIRDSGPRPVATKSTMLQVLRLGLVRTPEMELQDLKIRRRTSGHVITGRSDSVGSDVSEGAKKQRDRIGIFGSCKCSVGAIEPLRRFRPTAPRIVTARSDQNKKLEFGKLVLFKDDKKKDEQGKTEKQGKRVESHHRTFEWLIRDFSNTSLLNP